MEIWYILAGFFVAVLVGLTGVGGGAVMTPLLIVGFDIPAIIAVGTDLVYAAVSKSIGAYIHRKRGNIRWDLVKSLAMGSIPGSILSVYSLSLFESAQLVEQLITTTLGFCLILTALFILNRERIKKNRFSNQQKTSNHHYRLVIAGFFIGVLVTLSSIGAGALTAAVIMALYPDIDSKTLVGTDLTHALPLAIIAGLAHTGFGHVDFFLLTYLLIGSIPGVWLGVKFGHHLPDSTLKKALGWILILIGAKFIFS